jgi:hypothetical protein
MSAERQREIARQGGRAAQAKGTGHQFNHEDAVAAGQKGGRSAAKRGTAHRWTSAEAKAASRKALRKRKKQNP